MSPISSSAAIQSASTSAHPINAGHCVINAAVILGLCRQSFSGGLISMQARSEESFIPRLVSRCAQANG